ncbi:MAG TPA: hypothetical protein VJ044_20335 [Candidatus Hodarchaeales archaeon]|nr:hypothetical protein [Candidatus Hodarchaeales archaeon]
MVNILLTDIVIGAVAGLISAIIIAGILLFFFADEVAYAPTWAAWVYFLSWIAFGIVWALKS